MARVPKGPTAGPVRGAPKAGAGEAKNLGPIAGALLKAGIAATPKEAQALARALKKALNGKGISGPNLPTTLKLFQKAAGLPQTGKLDAATQKALVESGLLPPPKAKPGETGAGKAGQKADAKAGKAGAKPALDKLAGEAPKQWGTVGGKKGETRAPKEGARASAPGEAGHQVEIAQTKERAALFNTEDAASMRELVENLASFGIFGGGQGAKQLRDAVRRFQGKVGLPQTGKLDPETQQALKDGGKLESGAGKEGAAKKDGAGAGGPDGAGRAEGQGRGQGQSDAYAPPSERSTGAEQMRASADNAQAEAHARGVPEGKPLDDKGRNRVDGEGEGKRGKGGEGAGEDDADGLVDEGELDGTEGETGDSPAGDDDLHGPRGHATLDDGSDDAAGHYEIPPLSEQIASALDSILRDDDGRGAATYAWDVTFYKPGVYGAKQPAEPLWHIGVEGVSAFDAVWTQAQSVLESRLADVEPGARAPSSSDFEQALRRARYRDA